MSTSGIVVGRGQSLESRKAGRGRGRGGSAHGRGVSSARTPRIGATVTVDSGAPNKAESQSPGSLAAKPKVSFVVDSVLDDGGPSAVADLEQGVAQPSIDTTAGEVGFEVHVEARGPQSEFTSLLEDNSLRPTCLASRDHTTSPDGAANVANLIGRRDENSSVSAAAAFQAPTNAEAKPGLLRAATRHLVYLAVGGMRPGRTVAPRSSLFSGGTVVVVRDLSVVRTLVSFGDDSNLLRGSNASDVLARCAKIFASSAGSEATYEMSHVLDDHIDIFISHNWSVGRWSKFVALACYFNFNSAFITMLLVGCLATIIHLSGFTFGTIQQNNLRYPCSVVCRCISIPVFVIALFFSHDVQRLLPCSSPSVFLDKTCIHQVDLVKQRQAIEKLGAYIFNSERMVVLYTEEYLRKLWTVYEVASFLALRPLDRMTVMPVAQLKVFCWGLVFAYVLLMASMLVQWTVPSAAEHNYDLTASPYSGMIFAVYFVAEWLWTSTLRSWSRERGAIKDRLSNFTVEECRCFVPDDRAVVSQNIAILMRGCGSVPEDADDDEALECFDKLVQDELPHVFASTLGDNLFDGKYYFALFYAGQGARVLDYLCMVVHGCPPRRAVVGFLEDIAWLNTLLPLGMWIAEILASCFLSWSGWKDKLWQLCISLFTVVIVACFGWRAR